MAHELTHFIKAWSPAKYKVLANFLVEKYGEKGISVDELVRRQMEKMEKNGRKNVTYDKAFDEFVADSMETMLTSGNVIEQLAEIKKRDAGLWGKIKEFFSDLAKKLKTVVRSYKDIDPDSVEGQTVQQMTDVISELERLFTEGVADASENYRAVGKNKKAPAKVKTGSGQVKYSFRDTTNGMANDLLLPYNEELTRYIGQNGNFIVDSFESLQKTVNLAFDNKSKKAIAYFGIIDAKILKKIKDSIPNLPNTSKDILFKDGKDYSVAVTLDSIRHLSDEKGLSRNDIVDYLDRLADTIVDFDTVAFDYYKHDNQNIPGMLFKKEFDDGVLVSFDIVSHKKRSLLLQTLYMDSADYQKKKSAETMLMQNAHSNTSETKVGQTSIDSISQKSDLSSNEDEKSFSDRDPDAVSERQALLEALESTAKNEAEKELLANYKKELGLIEELDSKLSDIRSQLRELYFSKGKRDTDAIKKLKEQEVKTVNRINIRDKRLLGLEATNPIKDILTREKAKAYDRARQEGKRALAEYREKAVAKQKEIVQKNAESRKRAIESRSRTEVRNRIKRIKNDLEGMIRHPTDQKYIPIDLAEAMIDVCNLINTDTELYHKDGSLNKAQAQRNLTKQKLNDLKNEYQKLETLSDPVYAGEFDKGVSEYLQELSENYRGKNIADMSIDELNDMYYILRSIDEMLQDARKLIGYTEADNVYEVGDAIAAEQFDIANGRKHGRRNAAASDAEGADAVQEQSRAYLNDEYSTDGVHWMYAIGSIENSDVKFVWDVITNINKHGYNGYAKTVNGEYIADKENKIYFINADFHDPYVSKVIVFADNYETNMFEAKEWIRNAKGNETRHREALRFIEIFKGEGYAHEYSYRDYSSNGRQDGRGKGSYSGRDIEQTKIRKWRFDTEQEQQRTNTLTEREILERAANDIDVTKLTPDEASAFKIFQDRLSTLKDLQEQRSEQGKLYHHKLSDRIKNKNDGDCRRSYFWWRQLESNQ